MYALDQSPDGRYVLFQALAADLTSPGSCGYQIYLRDRLAGTTELISMGPTGVPAALKVGAAAHLLGRPDAAVLYAGVEDAAALTPLLRLCAGELQDSLAARIPPLTLELSRGLAVAEDPGDGQSFGQHRCGLLVRAARSHDHGADDDTLLRAARAALSSAGIDPVNPHRARDSMVGDGW